VITTPDPAMFIKTVVLSAATAFVFVCSLAALATRALTAGVTPCRTARVRRS